MVDGGGMMHKTNAPAAQAREKARISCKALSDGLVSLLLIRNGIAEAGVAMPGESVASVVAILLAAATEAAELSGQTPSVGGAPLAGVPIIIPTAIELTPGEAPESMALVIQAGMARICIALPKPRALAHAFSTASQSEDQCH